MRPARKLTASAALALVLTLVLAGCGAPELTAPTCDETGHDTLVLMAQSVPSAAQVPCIDALPSGWFVNALDIKSGGTRMTFTADETRTEVFLRVDFVPECSTASAIFVPSDEDAADRFEEVTAIDDGFAGTRSYVFDGGCVTYHFDVSGDGWSSVVNDASLALTFLPRGTLEDYVRDRTGGAVQEL